MSLTTVWVTQDIAPILLKSHALVCQELIISKYNHVTSHFKGNFMSNQNQVVKSSKNQYFNWNQTRTHIYVLPKGTLKN